MLRHLSFVRTLFRNRHRIEDAPRFLTHTVTFGCNARCVMCDSWKLPTEGDLTTDEIEKVYRQLPRMDAVRLTGGEPFYRRDMPEIAELARRHLRPLVLHITTNGFLTKRIVDFVVQRDRRLPLELLVSLDGVAEKHNEVRGNEKAWDMAIRTVRELAPRRKELRLVLRVNQTIVDADGVEHYRRLREVLRPLGVRNNVVLAYDTSATYNMERELDVAPTEIGEFKTFGEFTRDDLRELIAEVEHDLADAPLLERLSKRYYLRGIANRLLNHRGSPNPACVALHTHLRLFPNGDVPTCQFNSRTVGNLRQTPFAEVWKSVKAEEQRRWVRKCPGCWAECEVLPSAIYTGDLLFHSTLPIQDRRPTTPSRTPATATAAHTHDEPAGSCGTGCGGDQGGCGGAKELVELQHH
jgi:Fe-coproporphyrin III synthase